MFIKRFEHTENKSREVIHETLVVAHYINSKKVQYTELHTEIPHLIYDKDIISITIEHPI